MFTKQRSGYFYDPDPIRETSGGTIHRDLKDFPNPLGRNAGSVWEIAPQRYKGNHPATMPEELVRRCLAVSCPEGGTVLDPFGGAGTTALVAARMGLRAISIEIAEDYTREAMDRVRAELSVDPVKLAAD